MGTNIDEKTVHKTVKKISLLYFFSEYDVMNLFISIVFA